MKVEECYRRGLLKRIPADQENALRSLELSRSHIEDAAANLNMRARGG